MRIGILYDVPAPTAKSFTETNALVAGSWLVADLAESENARATNGTERCGFQLLFCTIRLQAVLLCSHE